MDEYFVLGSIYRVGNVTLGVVELKTFVLYSKCIRWFNISIILLGYNNFDKSCQVFLPRRHKK